MTRTALRTTAVSAALALLVTGCSSATGSDDGTTAEEFSPEAVELMVHTGPGGGSDVFARELTAILESEELVERSSWTVVNENGGSGAVAMAQLARLAGEETTVAMTTPTWLTTPLTNADAAVTIDQLTPIAQMVSEPMVMAVAADAPYESLEDFVAAAEADPGALVQTGGSVTAVDAIAGEVLKDETGADWSFLSFEGGGERVTALLSGDADMMFGAPSDFSEQVRAGELRVIATIGEERSELFPDAPTLEESGFDVEVPQQLRGLVGPPEMPEEAVAYYEGIAEEVSSTDAWAQYCEENGLTPVFAGADEWADNLEEQDELLTELLDELDLLAS